MSKEAFHETDGTLNLTEDTGLHRVISFNFVPIGKSRGIMKGELMPYEIKEYAKAFHDQTMRHTGMEAPITAYQYTRVYLSF